MISVPINYRSMQRSYAFSMLETHCGQSPPPTLTRQHLFTFLAMHRSSSVIREISLHTSLPLMAVARQVLIHTISWIYSHLCRLANSMYFQFYVYRMMSY